MSVTAPHSYKLGKREARHDMRLPMLTKHAPDLPPPPPSSNWYAAIAEVDMLGNDLWGCCVEATACHFLEEIALYINPGKPLKVSTAECLAIYSQITGFNPNAGPPGSNPTDQGTYVLGPGGMLEYWIKNGITVGGKLNKLTNGMRVDIKNTTQVKQAIHLFGGVLMGATMVASDLQQPFMWDLRNGPVEGGHEFLVNGYETLPHGTVYDLETWDGHRRMSEAWMLAAADEAVVVYNEAFFNARGVSPGGIDKTALLADMQAFA